MFFDEPEYQAKPIRCYNRLDHSKEVLGHFQRKEGSQIPAEILGPIKIELPEPKEATAVDVKRTTRKLKLTRYIEYLFRSPLPDKSLLTFAGKMKTRWSGCSNRLTGFTAP